MRGKAEVLDELFQANPHAARARVDRGEKETILHLCVKYNQAHFQSILLEKYFKGKEFVNTKDNALFVDNIPESHGLHWLQRTFNKFGVVKDAFIPWKRSKRTGNRFGFVRYGYHVSASMAVSQLNGVWVEDKKLFVKEACFGRIKKMKENRANERREFRNRDDWPSQQAGQKAVSTDGVSGQVVNGESSKKPSPNVTIQVNPIGNGWLFRSAVAVMHRVVPLMTLKVSFGLETDKVAQFRALGGRSVLITFQSQEVRDELITGPWMKRWFEAVKPWSGEPASHERFVWLGCHGLPLNAWDNTTFKRIGEVWGHFISVHEDTLKSISFAQGKLLIATEEMSKIERWIQLVVKGVKYDVLVKEISSFVNPDEIGVSSPGIQGNHRPVAELREQVGHGYAAKGVLEADDDLEVLQKGPTNEKSGVGEGAGESNSATAHGKEKKGERVGGPKLSTAGRHLMLDKRGVQILSEDFESLIEESAVQDSTVGLSAQLETQAPIKAHELPQDHFNSMDGPVDQLGASQEVGRAQERTPFVGSRSSNPNLEMKSPVMEVPEENLPNQLVVRSSQLPCINLLVDLNNTDCRKRRRRQLNNLLRIREDLDRDSSSEEASQSLSDDISQVSPSIINEVRATMAIGGELDINFLPNDNETLNRMIELEVKEFSLMKERGERN
ncbi:hypothetical protein RHGRI_033528 [Rhododendron griersonianum]|uniref:RRM domain-containing protein n=1 Tax=Rhododendron griersonianum TaxID=479676 RepID=A0AAV6I096_9ERIC|nr:hypothetical protein RHGRI_033528 [Rhododendron griersonianum]